MAGGPRVELEGPLTEILRNRTHGSGESAAATLHPTILSDQEDAALRDDERLGMLTRGTLALRQVLH